MIIEVKNNISKILEEMPDDTDAYVLSLSRLELKKNKWYVDTDVDLGDVAVSDSLEELKKYMTDNNLISYVEVYGNNTIRERYYYFYEIFRFYGEDKSECEHINSFYETLYYADMNYGYYKEEELNDVISWHIEHGECFALDDLRDMGINDDTIIIYKSFTDKVIETIKIEDLEQRQDIIDEIIRNNFEVVN